MFEVMLFKGSNNVDVPGAADLIAGDLDLGYYGQVMASKFITYNELSDLVGISAGGGTSGDWLKFSLEGKTLFVAKSNCRDKIPWSAINEANAVNGNRTVTIKENSYKIRLLKGLPTENYAGYYGEDPIATKGSEWNRLMYRVSNTLPVNNTEDIIPGLWEQFTVSSLMGGSLHSWTQEVIGGERMLRGNNPSSIVFSSSTVPNASWGNEAGWRPVLELVE